jgi:hypothetical protein
MAKAGKGEKAPDFPAYPAHTDRSVGVKYGNQPPGIMSREEFVPIGSNGPAYKLCLCGKPKLRRGIRPSLGAGAWTRARPGVGIFVLVGLQVSPLYGPLSWWGWCLLSPLPFPSFHSFHSFISHRHNGEPEARHFVAPPRTSPPVLAFPPQLFTMTRDGTRDCG